MGQFNTCHKFTGLAEIVGKKGEWATFRSDRTNVMSYIRLLSFALLLSRLNLVIEACLIEI